MMRIELEIAFSFKRELNSGYRSLELPEESNVEEALHEFVTRHPVVGDRLIDEAGAIRRNINALINGGNVTLREGFRTMLTDGDRLTILPPVGGG